MFKRILEKVKYWLSISLIQRLFYGIGLILWTAILWDESMDFSTPYFRKYLAIYLIPALLLFLQILFNNKNIWGLIFSLISFYSIYALYSFIIWAIESSDSAKSPDWSIESIFLISLFFGLLSLLDWIIYRLKPIKKKG